MFRVHLAGDESLSVPAISLNGNQLTLLFTDKISRPIDLSSVTSIEQLNGPISWLTAHKPVQNIYRPFFTESFPTRFDRTVADDKPIAEKYPGFHHGIGCHSYSMLVYGLSGQYTGFRTQFSIDSDSPLADVTVRIHLDDKVVFEEKHVRAGQIHPVVFVPLGNARTLGLEVDYGDNFATQDRFIWLDPALVRASPGGQ